MQITWAGNHTIKIISKDEVIVLDPYSPETGLPPFRSKATIVGLTNPQEPKSSHLSGIQGDPKIINSPGEYAIRGFTLYALGWAGEDNIEKNIQVWGIEDMLLLHVGGLNRDLTDAELQAIEKVSIDILFLPVGGGSGLSLKQALNLMTTIEPRIVIPTNFHVAGSKAGLEGVDKFAKELGVTASPIDKFVIKGSKLPEEDMETVILKP